MNRGIHNVLTTLKIEPVLVDIGASGEPPPQWKPIAQHSVYVGFDPDRRELNDVPNGQYARAIIISEAITSVPGQSGVHFYLTRSPYCSSTLPPDTESLSHYLFSDLFSVEGEVSVRASSLNAVIDRLGLQGVDWFKTDSQGTDLRLFQSLTDNLRDRVLAVDIEPGLIDAYRGEDLFVDAHRYFIKNGFWLSDLQVKGAIRMRRSTLEVVSKTDNRITETLVSNANKKSPCWCEARYLRTIESLSERQASRRDYALLWVFALLDRQIGFALDLAIQYEKVFGTDEIAQLMKHEPILRMKQSRQSMLFSLAKSLLPSRVKQWLKNMVKG